MSRPSPFAEPRFTWLFASNTTFFLALGGQGVLRSWLVYELTGSELALGLISATVALPMLGIAPLGGAVADRVDRRRLVAGGQALIVFGELATLVLLVLGVIQFWHLLGLALAIGAAFAFISPARQALVADVVGRERLATAMATNMAAVNTTRVAGPAAAGLLIGIIGLERAYAINVALYFGALLMMAGVGAAPPAEARAASIPSDVADGLRYLTRNRLVFMLLLFGMVPTFLAMPFQSLLVVFAEDIWKVGPEGLGLLSASAGIGGVVGSAFVAWRAHSPRRLRLMMLSVFGFGAFLFLFSLSPWFLVGVGLVFLANVFASLHGTLNNTAIQILIPDKMRGRVSSFLMMSFSLPLLGTLPVSAVAEVIGAPRAVAIAAVLTVVISLIMYLRSADLRAMDDHIRDAMSER